MRGRDVIQRLPTLGVWCIEFPDDDPETELNELSEDEFDGADDVRSVQVLDPDEVDSYLGFPEIGPQEITNFVAENLPPMEMLEIENALVINDALFEDYLAQRAMLVAEEGPKPPEELDNRVLDLIRASAA
jgi:hypothetical protein